jgi:hypothetical protein
MNANELADLIEFDAPIEGINKEAAAMLRQFGLAESIIKQQQLEIEALKKQNADMNRRLLGWDIYEQ